jgi:hypothetical protein
MNPDAATAPITIALSPTMSGVLDGFGCCPENVPPHDACGAPWRTCDAPSGSPIAVAAGAVPPMSVGGCPEALLAPIECA